MKGARIPGLGTWTRAGHDDEKNRRTWLSDEDHLRARMKKASLDTDFLPEGASSPQVVQQSRNLSSTYLPTAPIPVEPRTKLEDDNEHLNDRQGDKRQVVL